VMGWPLGLASEHPGLWRSILQTLKGRKSCPITLPALAHGQSPALKPWS
jgi:hypothetical protein